MVPCSDATIHSGNDLNSTTTLDDLYSWLRPRSKGLASGLPSLQGQEHDAEEDFVQEAVVRAFQYSLRAESEEYSIKSPKQFTSTIMRNYREDRRRKDHRLVRLEQLQPASRNHIAKCDQVDPAEMAIENVFQERLFCIVAAEIVKFPTKQKQALLTDLANRMYFDEEPTPLQRAFLQVGIHLQDYQQPIPDDPIAAKRFAAIIYYAYKRVANLERVQQYIAA